MTDFEAVLALGDIYLFPSLAVVPGYADETAEDPPLSVTPTKNCVNKIF
ncbi:hypothetical protein [Rhodococcus marinonascens]|nr:hypothetical protein [Rhodococcus marinonascens]